MSQTDPSSSLGEEEEEGRRLGTDLPSLRLKSSCEDDEDVDDEDALVPSASLELRCLG